MTIGNKSAAVQRTRGKAKSYLNWIKGISIFFLGLALSAFVVGSWTIGDLTTANSPTLIAGDFTDIASLTERLRHPRDSISQFVRTRLRQRTIAVLTNTAYTSAQLQGLILDGLNTVVRGPSIYAAKRFAGIKLSPATLMLLQQTGQGKDLVRLNRLLLADAFPEEIRPPVGEGRSGFWGLISDHLRLIQCVTLSFVLAALVVVIFIVTRFESVSNSHDRPKGAKGSARGIEVAHDSFWQAFPFASLVFFAVSIFMLCDLASNPDSYELSGGISIHMLWKLGLYLVTALVTSIVVLYGAHLVGFEHNVTRLTERAEIATQEVRESVDRAQRVEALMGGLEASAGMAIMALRVDADYRRVTPPPPSGFGALNPYVRARSSHAILCDEAVFRSPDHRELPKELLPSARNMISSFLEENAWDLGQRCLITNARNYTSFLVGAARGFEEMSDKRPSDLRVFYLTHTVATPAHLLNWPVGQPVKIEGHDVRICQPTQFMLQYMTYCRYFARQPSKFIHARLISATYSSLPVEKDADDQITVEPFSFSLEAFTSPEKWRLPTHCNAWGLPCWAQIAINNHVIQFFQPPHSEGVAPRIPVLDPKAAPFLFAATASNLRGVARNNVATESPHSLLWPLFRDGDNVPPAAAARPPLEELRQKVLDFIIRDETKEELLGWLDAKPEDGSGEASQILHEKLRMVKAAVNDFQSRVKSAVEDDKLDPIRRAHELLKQFEFLLGFRWAFQLPAAMTAWAELETGLFLLVNSYLAEQEDQGKKKGGLEPFMEWFNGTFHTDTSLGMRYARDMLKPESGASEYGDQEFALIGLLEVDDGARFVDRALLKKLLTAWLSSKSGGDTPIKHIIALKSSIDVPWKYAELKWLWECSSSIDDLKKLVAYYVAGMDVAC